MNARTRIGHGMQQLEDRRLMAGDVSVAFVSGDLIISGDNLGNRIDIATVNGQLRVTGNNWNGATTINGGSNAFAVIASAVDDIFIDMNGGDDRVFLNQVYLNAPTHGDLDVETGDGNDLVGIYNSSFRDLKLETEGGNDDAIVSYSAIARDLTVDLGSGDDELDLYSMWVGDDIHIEGRSGKDDVAIQYANCVDDLVAKLGDDDDILWINGGSFDDISIHAEGGHDRVTLQSAQVADDLFVDMGSGNDRLYLYDNQVGDSKFFHGGNGTDILGHSGNNFNPLQHDYSF